MISSERLAEHTTSTIIHRKMLSAAKKLLQRVPRTHLLLRPASTSVDAPSLHKLLQKRTDHELLSLQDNLKQTGDKQLAKQQLQSLLSDGKATTTHCKWALEHVSTGVKFDNGLLSAMQEKNIPIDEEARALAKANKGKYKMRRLKQTLTEQGKVSARKYFKRMQQDEVANAAHYGWAMKELCQSSDEKRALMESMKQNGVLPNVTTFNQLIYNLMHDGAHVVAQHVYDVDMPAAGIEPSDRTISMMVRADELASKGRTVKLTNILKQHGKVDAARQVFEEMQKSGHADGFQYGWALRHLCKSSDEMRVLIKSMKQHGVVPNVAIFTQLITTLLHDGDVVAAQHVFDVEMPAAGIEPDDITKQTMARADELASQGRTVKLTNMLKKQGNDAA